MPPSDALSGALAYEGTIYEASGDYATCAVKFEEAISVSRKAGRDLYPSLPLQAASLGECDSDLLLYVAARDNFELALKAARALNGDEHVDTLEAEARLRGFLSQVAQYREALRHLKHARDVCLKIKGADDPSYTPQMLLLYGQTLAASGHLEEGLLSITPAVENRRNFAALTATRFRDIRSAKHPAVAVPGGSRNGLPATG